MCISIEIGSIFSLRQTMLFSLVNPLWLIILFPEVDKCPYGQYRCANGKKCIRISQVCNKVDDCEGGDDEQHCWPGKS